MKIFKGLVILVLCTGILLSASSCVVYMKGDNGRHKGWFKNSHNPHHPYTTDQAKRKGNSGK